MMTAMLMLLETVVEGLFPTRLVKLFQLQYGCQYLSYCALLRNCIRSHSNLAHQLCSEPETSRPDI